VSKERQIYEIAFNFTKDPFSVESELDLFYLSKRVEEFLVELYSQIRSNSAFVVVFGEEGSGKSMLSCKIVDDLKRLENSAYIVQVDCLIPDWDVKDFLVAVLQKGGINVENSISFHSMVEAWLVKLIENKNIIRLLIVDNAHNLHSRNTLELLKTFNSLRIGKDKLINVVLFAKPDWEIYLDELEDFRDLFTIKFNLEGFTLQEVRDFIRWRLVKCGYEELNGPILDESAYRVVFAYTEGNPRKILKLLRNVFIELVSKGEKKVNSRLVLECIENKFHPSTSERVRIARALLEYDLSEERREEINKLSTKELEKWQRDIKSVEILLKEYEKEDI